MPQTTTQRLVKRIQNWSKMETFMLSREFTYWLFFIFQLPEMSKIFLENTSVETSMTQDIMEQDISVEMVHTPDLNELCSMFRFRNSLTEQNKRHFRKLYNDIVSQFIKTIQNFCIPDPEKYPWIFYDSNECDNYSMTSDKTFNNDHCLRYTKSECLRKNECQYLLNSMEKIINNQKFLVQLVKFITNQCYMIRYTSHFGSSMPSLNDTYDGNMLSKFDLIVERSNDVFSTELNDIKFFFQSFYKIFVLFQIKLSSNHSYEKKYWKKFFLLTTTGHSIHKAHGECIRSCEHILNKNSYNKDEMFLSYKCMTKYPICFTHYVINEPFINYPVRSIKLTYSLINLLLCKILDQYLIDFDVINRIGTKINKVSVLI